MLNDSRVKDNPNYITLEVASQLLNQVKRISVIGCSGGGKSTLSQRLSSALNLEYISIDRDVRWLPGWKVREASERRALYKHWVQGDRWIMDGTSPASFDVRLPRTDLVLWIRVPRRVALASVYKRVFKYYGTTRPDMASGCLEQMPDREFLSYIWNFEKKTAPVVIRQLQAHGSGVPILVLNSHRDMQLLTDQITANSDSSD